MFYIFLLKRVNERSKSTSLGREHHMHGATAEKAVSLLIKIVLEEEHTEDPPETILVTRKLSTGEDNLFGTLAPYYLSL